MAFVGEVEVEPGGFEWRMAQGARNKSRGHAGFAQMGGVGRAEGMESHPQFENTSAVLGRTEGARPTGATHGRGRRGTGVGSPPGGRQQPGGVPMGFPVGAQQRAGLGGQRDVAVFGACPPVDLETRSSAVGDLAKEGCVEPEAHTVDGGQVPVIVEGSRGREKAFHLLDPEDGGETVRELRTNAREGSPVTREDVLREEADAAVVEAHGGGGKTVDVLRCKK